jgi:hypothetical protein
MVYCSLGLPIAEAMAVGLPVCATNWSGQTHFMNQQNSYPLPYDGFVSVGAVHDFAEDQQWANPSLLELRRIMRDMYSNPLKARGRGRRARIDMLTEYNVDSVTVSLMRHIKRIKLKIAESTAMCQIYHDTVMLASASSVNGSESVSASSSRAVRSSRLPRSLECCWRTSELCPQRASTSARASARMGWYPSSLGCFDVIPANTAGTCICPPKSQGGNYTVLQATCDNTEGFTCAQQCMMLSTE